MRILIVDLEYLVAMGAERILSSAMTCEIQIAMPRDYPPILESCHFDVALVDSSLGQNPDEARRLRASGAGIVFSTLVDEELAGLPAWPDTAVVSKPFDERQLVEAVRNAARLNIIPDDDSA